MYSKCTVFKTTNFIGKRWTLVILNELNKNPGVKRYSELKNSIIEITPKLLSLRLKELEKEGLISKQIDASNFPIKCEYKLTDSGKDFIRIIQDMIEWALKWGLRNKVCENTDCQKCTL